MGFAGLRLDVYSGLLALLFGDGRRRVGERVDAAAGLGEGDHLADGVDPGQQRVDPVPAERDPAVRGAPKVNASNRNPNFS